MSKFVIWDDVDKSFRNDFKDFIGINTKGQLYSFKHNIEINEEYSIYYDIGLKDIKGKNIYANCSIVEFEYRRHINSDMEKRICIFTYCKHSLKYWLRFAGDIGTFEFNPQECKNFKIIDTIQENNLGLIK